VTASVPSSPSFVKMLLSVSIHAGISRRVVLPSGYTALAYPNEALPGPYSASAISMRVNDLLAGLASCSSLTRVSTYS
jgi:hypothetical protein